MALTYPGPYNVFLPSHKATAGLMAGFSRNPKSFALNQYIQIIPVDKPLGVYGTWNSKQAARIPSSDLSAFEWAPGKPAPSGKDNLESFAYDYYRTKRYCFPFTIDDETIAVADWNVLQAHSEAMAQQCMTAREYVAYGVWGNPAAWGLNTAYVDGVGGTLNGNAAILANGQNWTNGTTDVANIKATLNYCHRAINLATIGVVTADDMVVVMNPNTAMKAGASAEVSSYMGRSQFALDQIRGGKPGQNDMWGLPDQIAGFKIVVDSTVLDSAQKPIDSLNYLIPDGDVLVTSRKGGLEGVAGGPVFSTLALFYWKDDMTVESYHDVNDRLTKGRVVSNFTVNLVAPSAGFYLRKALG